MITYTFLFTVTYSFFTISVLHFRYSSRRFVFQHPQKSKHSLGCLFWDFLTYIKGLLKSNIHHQDKIKSSQDKTIYIYLEMYCAPVIIKKNVIILNSPLDQFPPAHLKSAVTA